MILRPVGSALLAVVAVGCSGDSHPQRHPVFGAVVYRGQPVAEAQVVLYPVTAPTMETPRPMGTTDEQGKFQLTTLTSNDGAPAGEYVVTVELRDLRMVGEEPVRDGRNLLPPKYARRETSDLRVEVKPGKNEIPTWELKD